jgi:hypothetical protein
MVVVVMAVAEADLTVVVAVASMEAAVVASTVAVPWRRVLPAAEHMDDRADTVDMARAEFRDTAAGRAVWAAHEREQLLQRALASVVRRRTAAE